MDVGKREILEHIVNARRDAKLGLIDTHHDITGFSFTEFVVHPLELTIVLGDGYNWVSNHIDALRERISDPRKSTRFFLLDPESTSQAALAAKMHMPEAQHRQRVQLTVSTLSAEAESVPDARLEIFGHHSVPHHSVFLGDRLAIAPYFFSRKMRNPPIFIFEKGSFLTKVRADLKELEKESSRLFPAQRSEI